MQTLTLKSGYAIPVIGLGTWLINGRRCYEAVRVALDIGYTHIDTAVAYQNEHDIGRAILDSGIPRQSLFITTKIWYEHLDYNKVLSETERSLDRLRTDYIDLILIHWPNSQIPLKETFDAFEQLKEEKKIRSVGVSNFTREHLIDAFNSTVLPVSVNQIEFHPYFNQRELLSFCKENGIVLTAYSPLGRGQVLKDPVILRIAHYRSVTPSQVVLAWALRKGTVVIPKASNRIHIEENLKSLQVELDESEMLLIDELDRDDRIVNPAWSEF